ncbi:MAG TPA: PD-(D/E)XK nuclease family protein, partial [Candidatus Woesebacteria bacterium]|nr:PD-(D/E)XK nuclease family protein [Candidatus Woesebacteria bacterium]
FLQSITTMQQHRIKIVRAPLLLEKNAVRLSTVHKAKGQEWQIVFIPGLIDGKWGNSKKRQLLPLPQELIPNATITPEETNAEERRLFYVALTRAKTNVYLSYSESVVNENRSKSVNQSEFLVALLEQQSSNFKTLLATDSLPKLDAQLERLLLPANSQRKLQSQEREYYKYLVSNFSLSVSSLNKYLRSPENFALDVLLRLPKAKEPAMAFGTAVHTALEHFYKQSIQLKTLPQLPTLQTAFLNAIEQEVLTESEFTARKKHGIKILENYYHNLPKELPKIVSLETFFGHGQHPTYLHDIHLSGRVDRIDAIHNSKNHVRVIDYKTGKPKSSRAILGLSQTDRYSPRELALPEPIRGEYKRQLLFYKLLADVSPNFTSQVKEGVFEFVEPNTSGKIIKHQFELHDEEVELLKQLIIDVMAEIRGLAFVSENDIK